MHTLYWFTRDLRLHDNAALLAASKSDALLCVYVVDPRWFAPGPLQCRAIGTHRWRFLWQSLMALERSLRALGQRLHIAYGSPEEVIPALTHSHKISRVIRSRQPGTREAGQWQSIRDKLPGTVCQEFETLSLYGEGSLPMSLEDLPDTFSKFRKLVEKSGDRGPELMRIRTLTALPPAPGFPEDNRGECPAVKEPLHPAPFTGGEKAGLARLQEFLFGNHAIDNYKQTRNESTYWLWFELLWREYFYWYAMKHGADLFRRNGVQRKRRPATRSKLFCERTGTRLALRCRMVRGAIDRL